MAPRSHDVAGIVQDVVGAFNKAIKLVQRIEERKDAKEDAETVRDLFKSLTLGPIIVQGYFDADSKRLGVPYLIGDYEAQVQLRDVLLNLKTLVGDLSDALLDDKELDLKLLQDASDTCRVNAGVCLGQLSQRLVDTRDPMSMHIHHPQSQYMSGVPSSSLHYSTSRSTQSSAGRLMPKTPDPYHQQHTLSPQWQPKQSEHDDQYYPSHQRQGTGSSISENYNPWSASSHAISERDPDELSMRRPSSHTLAPEDGALLSLPPEGHSRPQLLPGQQDLVRDSYTSLSPSSGAQSPAAPSAAGSQGARDRYGPDGYTFPRVEQHGPFMPDRDSAQSATSYANRAFSIEGNHSTLEALPHDFRQTATPQPLRLPYRPGQQPSTENTPQLRKPVPVVPYDQFTSQSALNKYNGIPLQVPTTIHGMNVPIPPRSNSRPIPTSAPSPQLLPNPQAGPPYQPSPSVQRAIDSGQNRRQYDIDRSLQYTPQQQQPPPPPPPPPTQNRLLPSNPQNSYSTSPLPVQPFGGVAVRENEEEALRQLQPRFLGSAVSITALRSPPNIPQPPSAIIPRSPPIPQQPPASLPMPAVGKPLSVSSASIRVPSNLPLILPTEKTCSPYCKGAFRLMVGLTKKAFVAANRPMGMASFIPYWRCDRCLFEGVMVMAPGPPDKKGRPGKPEKIFDPTIRECGPISAAVVGPDGRGEGSGGVRYRWAFLAKCHVPLKTTPPSVGKPDGSFGSFVCIFCTAEGEGRGWTGPDTASVFSVKSGNSGSGSTMGTTPVFGSLQLFMDHLQMHRKEENWPCPEMQGRMKCIVGRVADRGEDWEINFLPL